MKTMKNMTTFRSPLFLIIYLLTFQVYAQSIQPFDATIKYDNAQRPCLQVNLDPEPSILKDAWRDYLKDQHEFKLKGIGFLSNKDLMSAEAVTVHKISSKAMDFYTHIVEGESGSEMKVFARHGYDIYIAKETYPSEYKALREILQGFIKYYLPIYYEEIINEAEKQVNDLTKSSSNLKKEIDKNTRDIEKLKKEIMRYEEELNSNKKQLALTEQKLKKGKDKLEKIRIQLKSL